jgi:hypothetical protein
MNWSVNGSFTTAAANETLNWTTVYPNAEFVGPIVVAGNVDANGENFGQLTPGSVSVEATYGNPNSQAYNPISYQYNYSISNDNPFPISYNIAIGVFQ